MFSFLQTHITPIMTFLTLASNIVFVLALIAFAVWKEARQWIVRHITERPLEHIFIISLVAAVGSLLFSNVVGFEPCELCWFQRIVMYPQVVISFVALMRKSKSDALEVVYYVLSLSVIGALIALYHSFILWGGKSLIPCTQAGSACAKLYVFDYGYITIPFMALTIFVYLIAVSLVYLYGRKQASL